MVVVGGWGENEEVLAKILTGNVLVVRVSHEATAVTRVVLIGHDRNK